MTLSIDHIVIFVSNLQAAINDFRQVGFIANYGGKHADGITENALIIFGDGAYLELIALTQGSTIEAAAFKDLVRQTEGYTGYALLTADLEGAMQRLARAGLATSGVREGSRYRPDGALLQWRMTRIGQHMSPFIIKDVTPRDLRVPMEQQNIDHPNTVTGVRDIKILVQDFAKMIDAYRAITDIVPQITEHEAVFMLDNSSITLSKPANPDQQHYLAQYASVPYELTFASNDEQTFILHGARMILAE